MAGSRRSCAGLVQCAPPLVASDSDTKQTWLEDVGMFSQELGEVRDFGILFGDIYSFWRCPSRQLTLMYSFVHDLLSFATCICIYSCHARLNLPSTGSAFRLYYYFKSAYLILSATDQSSYLEPLIGWSVEQLKLTRAAACLPVPLLLYSRVL